MTGDRSLERGLAVLLLDVIEADSSLRFVIWTGEGDRKRLDDSVLTVVCCKVEGFLADSTRGRGDSRVAGGVDSRVGRGDRGTVTAIGDGALGWAGLGSIVGEASGAAGKERGSGRGLKPVSCEGFGGSGKV